MKLLFKLLPVFLSVIFIVDTLSAQESLLLTSGKRIDIQAVNLDSAAYVFYKTPRGKIKALMREEVFSWTRSDSVEVIFYKPACEDVCFKTEQMRFYLNGIADAKERKYYAAFSAGLVSGGLSGVFIPSILAPLAPAAVAGGFGLPRPKISSFEIEEKYRENRHYAEGYTQTVRKKRILNAIIGGGIGLIIGVITKESLIKD